MLSLGPHRVKPRGGATTKFWRAGEEEKRALSKFAFRASEPTRPPPPMAILLSQKVHLSGYGMGKGGFVAELQKLPYPFCARLRDSAKQEKRLLVVIHKQCRPIGSVVNLSFPLVFKTEAAASAATPKKFFPLFVGTLVPCAQWKRRSTFVAPVFAEGEEGKVSHIPSLPLS